MKIKTHNTQEIKKELQSFDSFDLPNCQLIHQKQVNFEDFDQILNQVQGFKALRFNNQEEEAILVSRNQVCKEIIRKNLLPITLDLERIKLTGKLTIKLAFLKKISIINALNRNYQNHNQQNSFVENSCFIYTDQQPFEKSQSEIQVYDNNDAEVVMLNKQFSPNFSDVCKRISFTGLEEPTILLGKATFSKELPNGQMHNTKYEQQLNYQF
ncbi:unnamed protein product [Paramecium octaurelia]|uniref:Uncharacterized protein n=1 Tax=Paramecium octaurelia TaxID=43137 RepID=A0A8S1U718_PAROT|nr:unnamed protein product [Paramecium octaurelia]